MGAFLNIFGSVVVGICLLSISLLLFGLFGFLRNLPTVFNFIRRVLGWIMLITFNLYRPIHIYLQPLSLRYIGVDLLQVPARIASSIFLSVALLLFIHFTTGWHISAFGIGIAILHGFSIGLIWDEIGASEGLHLGEKLE